jgi:hypothetical protein
MSHKGPDLFDRLEMFWGELERRRVVLVLTGSFRLERGGVRWRRKGADRLILEGRR